MWLLKKEAVLLVSQVFGSDWEICKLQKVVLCVYISYTENASTCLKIDIM